MRRNPLFHAFIALGAIAVLVVYFKGEIVHEPFDSKEWKNWVETEETWSLRWNMMNSLRNSHQILGESQSAIIELLGEPESKTLNEYIYYLGYSKRGINTGFLTIVFDERGYVKHFRVWDG